MPTLREMRDRAVGQVNSLTSAVKFSKGGFSGDTVASLSVNPIEMLADILKSLKGYDWLVEQVSKFIVYVLPGLEWSVKGILLANIQAMVSCSVNPLITKKLIQEGTVFDLNQIDLLNMFRYSPLDTSSSRHEFNPRRNYYYFGCTPEDGINYIDDLKKSRDFNAVLWYAKNTPDERIVWRRAKDTELPVRMVRRGLVQPFTWLKQAKSNGIVTIEFNRNSDSLTTSEGLPMAVQEPMANCLHAWIGCNVPLQLNNEEDIRSDISDKTKDISRYDSLVDEIGSIKSEMDANLSEILARNDISEADKGRARALRDHDAKIADLISSRIVKAPASSTLSDEVSEYLPEVDANGGRWRLFQLAGANGEGRNLYIPQDLLASTRKKTVHEKTVLENSLPNRTSSEYPVAESNYYYMRTLAEFNTDFVMSMNPLFDAKVVTAQLIDALTGMFSLSSQFTVSLQAQFIQAQIREIVTKVIERDGAVVNDCFFSFTNDSYNEMLRQVELARAGLVSLSGQSAQAVPSAEDVMSALNSLSPDATKEEVQTAVAGTIFKAVSSSNPHGPGYLEFGVVYENQTVLTVLLEKLVYVIVSVIVSPKVYILVMMNLKIMEIDELFDLQKFIMQFKNMIVELVQSIKNEILDWFIEQLNILVKEVAAQLATRLVAEQYEYYVNLFNRCVRCLQLHGAEYDWNMDDVNYADITGMTEYAAEEC